MRAFLSECKPLDKGLLLHPLQLSFEVPRYVFLGSIMSLLKQNYSQTS